MTRKSASSALGAPISLAWVHERPVPMSAFGVFEHVYPAIASREHGKDFHQL